MAGDAVGGYVGATTTVLRNDAGQNFCGGDGGAPEPWEKVNCGEGHTGDVGRDSPRDSDDGAGRVGDVETRFARASRVIGLGHLRVRANGADGAPLHRRVRT